MTVTDCYEQKTMPPFIVPQLKRGGFDMVLTTYEMAMGAADRPLLASVQYNILIVVCVVQAIQDLCVCVYCLHADQPG